MADPSEAPVTVTQADSAPPLTCAIDVQGRSKLTSGESILKSSIRSFLTHLTNACIDHSR